MGNPYRAKSSRPRPTPSEARIPAGTVANLLTWVGEDKIRAQRVLDQENAQDKPRKSLTEPLKEIIGE